MREGGQVRSEISIPLDLKVFRFKLVQHAEKDVEKSPKNRGIPISDFGVRTEGYQTDHGYNSK